MVTELAADFCSGKERVSYNWCSANVIIAGFSSPIDAHLRAMYFSYVLPVFVNETVAGCVGEYNLNGSYCSRR